MIYGKRIARGVGVVTLTVLHLGAAPCRAQEPAAWVLDGSDSDGYRLRLDRDVARSGDASLRLEARGNRRTREWAVAVQMLDASAWRGKKVRLAGWLRTEDAGSGHLWMRIDGIIEGEAALIAVDNMEKRFLEGTRGWTAREVVLEVPPESVTILYGAMITGDGTVWADDLAVEEAPPGTEPTAGIRNEILGGMYDRPMGMLAAPLNLDFEAGTDGF